MSAPLPENKSQPQSFFEAPKKDDNLVDRAKQISTEKETREDLLNRIRHTLEENNKKELSPQELMDLVTLIRKKTEGKSADAESPKRYKEVTDAYAALEEAQFILTRKVSVVRTENLTKGTLAFVGWVGDIASNSAKYARSKERWWAKRVNRPNKEEGQDITDRGLNSSHANFVEKFKLTESALRVVNENKANMAGKNQLITGFAFEYLRQLVVYRGEKTHDPRIPKDMEVVLPYAGLKAKKDFYSIVIHRGKYVQKIQIPARLINYHINSKTPEAERETFEEFHRIMSSAMSEPLPDATPRKAGTVTKPTKWIDSNTLGPKILAVERHAKTGKEDTTSAMKRRANMADITAGDFGVVIMSETEMSLNDLQSDYRLSNYGVGFPVKMAFGVNNDGEITEVGAKFSHAYTDGGYAAKELLKSSTSAPSIEDGTEVVRESVSARAFDHIQSPKTAFGDRPVTQPKEIFHPKDRTVWEVSFQRKQFEGKINELREYFSNPENITKLATGSEKLDPELIARVAKGLTLQNLITLAIMAAFDLQHANFLESVKNTPANKAHPVLKEANQLAPAIVVANEALRESLRIRPVGPARQGSVFELLTAISMLSSSRTQTRDGKGAGQIFGAILENDTFRNSMQGSGEMLDPLKTEMLTDSTLISELVGGENPLDYTNEYLMMEGFTTAFGDTYQDEVFGACDRIGPHSGVPEVALSLRRKKKVDRRKEPTVEPQWLQAVPSIMERILGYLSELQKDIPLKADSFGSETQVAPMGRELQRRYIEWLRTRKGHQE